ncbi:NACHT domain-containing protein [Mesorhizobium shangrilense]|uniref:NACHT C-terminal Alpha/Beta 2 domain-containing protein n=1 Tax=Mesorhizobium shangrilense TaxID=460060 RepID=A0ABV2DLR9_9HYPH
MATLTAEERASAKNGIWLCQNCGKLIDSDSAYHTLELLRDWKRKAQDQAFVEVSTGRLGAAANPVWEGGDTEVWTAAAADLAKFKSSETFPKHPISVSLAIQGYDRGELVTAVGLAAGLSIERELLIAAPPGTGKSTAMIQIAEALVATRTFVPIIVPLNEWSVDTSIGFISEVAARNSFEGIDPGRLKALAASGRLAVLLDGWNELDEDARLVAAAFIKKLRRDYPQLRLAGSTRQEAVDTPFNGRRVDVQPLSEDQQFELARAIVGEGGTDLMERAWRTHGLRDLVSNPFYLTALAEHSPTGNLPASKDEVLNAFVARIEVAHAQVLRTELEGAHAELLTGLAMAMSHAGKVGFSDAEARAAISEELKRLRAAGQIGDKLLPGPVIDALVAHHLLVRSGCTVMFHHHQFQEWYASNRVADMIVEAAAKPERMASLAADILDRRIWAEAVLFAVERLGSGSNVEQNAAAAGIIWTLGVDPILAAEMIFRSSDAVWNLVKHRVTKFVERWHRPGTVDRAVRFMVTTGRGDFAPQVWALVSASDSNTHLGATRAASRFRSGVLGHDAAQKLSALTGEVRRHALGELASHGDFDSMTLAAGLATNEPDPKVRADVVGSLLFRRCKSLAALALKEAPDDVWFEVARHGYDEEFEDPVIVERIVAARQKMLAAEKNPLEQLAMLSRPGTGKIDADDVVSLIAGADFEATDHRGAAILRNLLERDTNAVARGMFARMAAGKKLPFGGEELLEQLDAVDEGSIVELALRQTVARHERNDAILVAGPKTVGKLIHRLLAQRPSASQRTDPAAKPRVDAYWGLHDLIQMSRGTSFGEALLRHADETDIDTVIALADLLSGHGRDRRGASADFPPEMKTAIAHMAVGWAKRFVASDAWLPWQCYAIIGALQRVADEYEIDALIRVLEKDVARHRAARIKYDQTHLQSDLEAVRHHPHYLQIRQALVAIGGDRAKEYLVSQLSDPEFGAEAAIGVRLITAPPVPREGTFQLRWPDFSNLKLRRAKYAAATAKDCSKDAVTIFGVVESLISPGSIERDQLRALALASTAFMMPCGGHDDLARCLLALPLPLSKKLHFLNALAAAGLVVPADLVLSGVADWVERSKKEWWVAQQERYELNEWLRLLPVSDRPAAVLDGFNLLPDDHHRISDLAGMIGALGDTPDAQGLELLFELARRDPRIVEHHQWLYAVLSRREPEMVIGLVEFCHAAGIASKKVETWYAARSIAPLVAANPTLREELAKRYDVGLSNPANSLVEQIFADEADGNAVLAMIRHRGGGRMDGTLRMAIEHAVTARRYQNDEGTQYEIYPINAAPLRKALFVTVCEGGAIAGLAKDALAVIDETRDRYGFPEDEPRHPDVASNFPWPPEAVPDRWTRPSIAPAHTV